MGECDGRRSYEAHVPDVATVRTNAGIPGYPIYGHGYYPAEQSMSHRGEAEAAGQYVMHPLTHPSLHKHAAATAIPDHSGHTAEWSQYPLFSYPCW